MKDEIKMILDDWKIVDNGKKNYIVEVPSIHIRQILDYITNLQEEVKSANESITWWQNRFNALQEEKDKENQRLKDSISAMEHNYKLLTTLIENGESITQKFENGLIYQDYKSRVEKAIEKIIKIQENAIKYGADHDAIICQDLLNILNGGDDNGNNR